MKIAYDTAGTGFMKRGIRQLMTEPEANYLGSLGDEIMLLEGLDDGYPHGYSDGPAMNITPPTQTGDQFGISSFELGMAPTNLGAAVQSTQWKNVSGEDYRYTGLGASAWSRNDSYRYTGLGRTDYRYTGLGRTDYRYTGLGRTDYRYTGLGASAWRRNDSYRYTGLGDAAADRATALSIAQGVRNACQAACGALTGDSAQRSCRSGCDSAYSIAEAAINATTSGAGGAATMTEEERRRAIEEKLAAQAAASSAASGTNITAGGSGIDQNTLIIGGLVVAGLVGVYLVTRK